MQPGATRTPLTRNGVAAGSVWEKRMKFDEVSGGIKVFSAAGDARDDAEGLRVHGKLRRSHSEAVGVEKRKRKGWRQVDTVISSIQVKKLESTEIVCKSEVEKMGVLLNCDGIEVEIGEQKGFDDKEMDLPVENEKEVEEVREFEKTIPFLEDLQMKDTDPGLQCKDDEEEKSRFENIYEGSNCMQHIVDLVMWRDISKTSFVFGFGTFFLLSSSYAKDLNFSFISVISYLGLLYLAAIFVLRSILQRGKGMEFNEREDGYLVGEEEAIIVLRRILPYFNEMLSRTRDLFSGDPATTMKMAVILFIFARCGSSITMWTMIKLAFYGVFTVPKILSSYSVQLSRYGQFWLARFRDGWESCTHKKVIAAAIFTLIWNLSSAIARFWAVFMLVISIRLYQQCTIMHWDENEEATEQNQQHQQHSQQQQQQHDVLNKSGIVSRLPRGGSSLVTVGRNVNTKKMK